MVTVACCQVDLDLDQVEETRRRVADAVAAAVGRGAEIVILPELATCGTVFRDRAEAAGRAEPATGAEVAQLRALSAHHGVVLIAGIAENDPDGSGPYNSAVVIDHGELLAVYRKTHLWDREKLVFVPGSAAPPVVATSAGRIAPLICYDAEFPELMRDVTHRGAQLIAVPANWPVVPKPASERPMEVIKAQASAAVNKVYVAVADRAGTERGVPFFGASMITDDHGFLLAGPGTGQPELLLADLDLPTADDKRIGPHNDVLTDQRLDLDASGGATGSGVDSTSPHRPPVTSGAN